MQKKKWKTHRFYKHRNFLDVLMYTIKIRETPKGIALKVYWVLERNRAILKEDDVFIKHEHYKKWHKTL